MISRTSTNHSRQSPAHLPTQRKRRRLQKEKTKKERAMVFLRPTQSIIHKVNRTPGREEGDGSSVLLSSSQQRPVSEGEGVSAWGASVDPLRRPTWELRQGRPQQINVVLFSEVLTSQAALGLHRFPSAGHLDKGKRKRKV